MSDVTISAAGLRIIKLLVGNPARTVTELVALAGVTRTAVTEQLGDLVQAGFVERTKERLESRGRPHHRYAATQAALLLLFADSQHLVVPAVWRAVDQIGCPELTKAILEKVSRLLADHYCAKITAIDPKPRLLQFMRVLEEEGGLVEVTEREGHLTVSKRSCAFLSMCDEKRTVCAIELDMISAIVGCPVRRVACRHDGSPRCSFELEGLHQRGAAAVRT
jgi:predicted ArsR family transcriptional regulator